MHSDAWGSMQSTIFLIHKRQLQEAAFWILLRICANFLTLADFMSPPEDCLTILSYLTAQNHFTQA